jgi:hypothetical protein
MLSRIELIKKLNTMIKLNSRKSIYLTVLLLTFLTFKTYSQNYGDVLGQQVNTITTAVPFLMIAPDARAGGMGDAGVSTSPDANSMHWNPAKFAFVERDFGVSFNYTPWLRSLVNDINLSYLSGFYRIDELQTVAASLTYFSLGDIQFTGNQGEIFGTYRPSEFSLDAAYARKLSENISGSIAVRYIYSNLTQGMDVESMPTKPGTSLAADVSAYYQKDIEVSRIPARFAAGINVSNIGNKISYSDEIYSNFIPINLRVGPTLSLFVDEFNTLAFTLDFNKLLVPTPPVYENNEIVSGRDPNRGVVSGMLGSFSDAPGGFKEEMKEITYGFGMEYIYDQQFAIRGGYFHEHELKGNRKFFTMGLGLKYNVFGLDFSYIVPVAQRSPLENVLRLSLIFDLDAWGSRSSN